MNAADLPIPSNELANKINVNEPINRFQEAQAEDFIEIVALYNALRNFLQGKQYVDDDLFLGLYSNASLLESIHPEPLENSYALIRENTTDPVIVASYTSVGGWVYSSVNNNLFVYVDEVSDLPSTGDSSKIYVVVNDKSYYHYLNNTPVLLGSQSAVKTVSGVTPNSSGNVNLDTRYLAIDSANFVPFGSFDIHQSYDNRDSQLKTLQIHDIASGWINENVFVFGQYKGGETSDINNWNVITEFEK